MDNRDSAALGVGALRDDVPVDVPMDVVQRLREICEPLPDAYEEEAWVGIRFRVRNRTFVHCCAIDEGGHRPCPGTRAPRAGAGADVRVRGRGAGDPAAGRPPFWTPPWRQTVVGMFLDDDTDWAEVAELVTESYCVQAPQRLRARVRRPAGRAPRR